MVLKIQAGQVTKMLYSVVQSYRTPTVRTVLDPIRLKLKEVQWLIPEIVTKWSID